MDSQNELQEPSPAPDFNAEIREAQQTGDFDFVMNTAKQSKKMLCDFRDAVKAASFPGRDSVAIGMGLNFLENMIGSSEGQINALRKAEKETKEALKKAMKAGKGSPTDVVGPEEVPAETPAPEVAPDLPPPASPATEATNG